MVSSAVRELAAELEDHGTSRANFRSLSDSDRYRVARVLVIARSQVNATNADFDNSRFRWHMHRKKEEYLYVCGDVGISMEEARGIWWSVVYGGVAPVDRGYKI